MDAPSNPAPPQERRPSRWISLISLAGFLLLLLAMLELAARVLVARGDNPTLQRVAADYRRLATEGPAWIRFIPDPELSYRLRPNFETGGTRHNSAGFRGAEFGPKAEGTLRIACLGASTTYGVGVDNDADTYPARLEALLNGRFKPEGLERVEVLNLGVGGYTSREMLGTLRRILPQLDPDIVLIQSAINDVIPRFYPGYAPDYSHFRTPFTSLDVSAIDRLLFRSQAWLSLAYGMGWIRPLSLQSQTQRPLPPVDEALANLAANAPAGFEANLSEAIATARAAGCDVWLLTQAYLDVPEFAGPNEASRRLESGYREGLAEHTALVIATASAAGTGLIRLDELTPRNRSFFTDPIHMSAAGNQVKAELIATALAPSMARPAP